MDYASKTKFTFMPSIKYRKYANSENQNRKSEFTTG